MVVGDTGFSACTLITWSFSHESPRSRIGTKTPSCPSFKTEGIWHNHGSCVEGISRWNTQAATGNAEHHAISTMLHCLPWWSFLVISDLGFLYHLVLKPKHSRWSTFLKFVCPTRLLTNTKLYGSPITLKPSSGECLVSCGVFSSHLTPWPFLQNFSWQFGAFLTNTLLTWSPMFLGRSETGRGVLEHFRKCSLHLK